MKNVVGILCVLFFVAELYSQASNPPPCNPNSPMAADLCVNATPICSFQGYCGNTSSTYTASEPGNLSDVFCGSIENNSWLSFVADSTFVELEYWVSNCISGSSVQMEIYSTTDFITYTPVSNCVNDEFLTYGVIQADNVTIGETYYLMVDGWAGAVCDYTIAAGQGVYVPNNVYADGVDITNDLAVSFCPDTSYQDSIQLVVTNGMNWVWSPSTGLSDTIGDTVYIVDPTPITYTVTGQSLDCGMIVQDITIQPDSGKLARIEESVVAQCEGSPVQIPGSGEGSFQWFPSVGLSNDTIANPFVQVSSDQLYVLNSSCGTDSVFVHIVPAFDVVIDDPDTICSKDTTTLQVSTFPDPVSAIDFEWMSNNTLGDHAIPNPMVFPQQTTSYVVKATSNSGCVRYDTTTVVVAGSAPDILISASAPKVCPNSDVELSAQLCYSNIYSDNFNATPDMSLWSDISEGKQSATCGVLSGDALYFSGIGERYAETHPLDVRFGGDVRFYLKYGKSSPPCEEADYGDEVVLEYSIDGGNTWTLMGMYSTDDFATYTLVEENIPSTAQQTNTKFRIRQIDHSGNGFDNWSIEDVVIESICCGPQCFTLPYTLNWSSDAVLNTNTGNLVTASLLHTTTFNVVATDGICTSFSTKTIEVDTSLQVLDITQDTFLCSTTPITLPLHVEVSTDTSTPAPVEDCAQYSVSSIPYEPAVVSGTSLDLGDEALSSFIDIGFDFEYFCNSYSQLQVSSNGFVVFDGGAISAHYNNTYIPNTSSPNNLIAFAWDDLNPYAGGSIQYDVVGTSPNRTFILAFDQVNHYGGSETVRVQIQLHETSNYIDFHITDIQSDGASMTMTQGIENANGSNGYYIPGRNNSNFTVQQGEGWRFQPLWVMPPANTVTYSWSPSTYLNDASISNPVAVHVDQSMSYAVTIQDTFCTYTDTVNIIIDSKMFLDSVSVEQTTCANMSDGSIEFFVSGGQPPYTYSIDGGLIYQSDSKFGNLSSGTYMLRVEDANGLSVCEEIDTTVLLTSPTPILFDSVGVQEPTCRNTCDGEVTVFMSDLASDYQYDLYYNNSLVRNQSSNHFTGLCGGEYSLIIQRRHSGCDTAISFSIAIPSSVQLHSIAHDEIMCHGDAAFSTTLMAIEGTEPYVYQVNNHAQQQSATFHHLTAGSYLFSVTDADGCTADTTYMISEPTPLSLQTTVQNERCTGHEDGKIILEASGATMPYVYSLERNSIHEASNSTGVFENLPPSELYTVNVTDRNGCNVQESVIVSSPPVLAVEVSDYANPTCFDYHDGMISLSASGGTGETYWFALEDGAQSTNNAFTQLSAGVYQITVTDSNQCQTTISQTLINPPPVYVQIDSEAISLDLSGSQQVHATTENAVGEVAYYWSPSAGLDCHDCYNPVVQSFHDQTYVLTVTDENGCASYNVAQLQVTVNNTERYFIPNAFSPNADGVNDYLKVLGEGIQQVHATMYNRWGEKIHESTDMYNVWDGIYKGVLQPPGVYSYYLEVTFLDGVTASRTGSVTLIR